MELLFSPFGMGFSMFEILFTLMFLLVFGLILFTVISGIRQLPQINLRSPWLFAANMLYWPCRTFSGRLFCL